MTDHPGPLTKLDALNQLDTPQSWRAPNALRRTASRRRRRTRGAVAGVAGVAVAALVVTLAQPDSGPGPSPVRIATSLHTSARSGAGLQLVSDVSPLTGDSASAQASARAVAQAEQDFALTLLQQTNSSGSTDNVALSPSSLSIALTMLQNGAAGETRDQIAKVLQTSDLSNDQQDAGWASLTADLTAAAKQGFSLESANSLWLQQNFPVQQPFMDAMARYFRAGVWQVDFDHNLSGASQALNAWVNKQTHGKITKLFKEGDIDQTTVMVLANALYFKAKWQYPFNPKLTGDAAFQLPDGTTTSVPFMHLGAGGGDLPAVSTPEYQAVQLPYQGGRLAALAIMPKHDSLSSFVAGLDANGLRRIGASLKSQPVSLSLPRFRVDQYTNLRDILSALGMPLAFHANADFMPMSPARPFVQSAVQRDYLSVDEAGTEAAAVTGLGMTITSLTVSLPLAFDHPFLFLVRDTVTGTILFSAEIQHPGQ